MTCFFCAKQFKDEILLYDRLTICKSCFKKNQGARCQCCNMYYLKKDLHDKDICKFCFEAINNNDENKLFLHNYFFKPYPTFFTISDEDKLFFGIQLQIGETTRQNVNKFSVQNQSDFFYIKYDSTIPKYGCQIVSYPATLQYHKSNLSKWKTILKNAKKYNFKSFDTDNCGCHIHINRSFFNQQQISMIDFFVNFNKKFIYEIARRETDYSRFLNKPIWLYGFPINNNRHCALNLLNQNTIQFRFFKGTLNYNSLISYIEFVYCLCYFVKRFSSVKDFVEKCDIELFLDYCNNLKQINYLNSYFLKIKLNKFNYKKGEINDYIKNKQTK